MATKGSSDMVQAMSFVEEFVHVGGLNELCLDYRVITTVILLKTVLRGCG